MCFLRDLGAESAQNTLTAALPHSEKIVAVGLDSTEVGNPPAIYTEVFERARLAGWRCVAHAGEEGPPEYISEALDLLQVERIDHGVRCMEDPVLVARLRRERIPLTVCPFSNVKLRVVKDLRAHPLGKMLAEDLVVTCNSDDPAYFGGYVGDNLRDVCNALALPPQAAATLARNSFEAAFLSAQQKAAYLALLEASLTAVEQY
jgi:adenosine deaminase